MGESDALSWRHYQRAPYKEGTRSLAFARIASSMGFDEVEEAMLEIGRLAKARTDPRSMKSLRVTRRGMLLSRVPYFMWTASKIRLARVPGSCRVGESKADVRMRVRRLLDVT